MNLAIAAYLISTRHIFPFGFVMGGMVCTQYILYISTFTLRTYWYYYYTTQLLRQYYQLVCVLAARHHCTYVLICQEGSYCQSVLLCNLLLCATFQLLFVVGGQIDQTSTTMLCIEYVCALCCSSTEQGPCVYVPSYKRHHDSPEQMFGAIVRLFSIFIYSFGNTGPNRLVVSSASLRTSLLCHFFF